MFRNFSVGEINSIQVMYCRNQVFYYCANIKQGALKICQGSCFDGWDLSWCHAENGADGLSDEDIMEVGRGGGGGHAGSRGEIVEGCWTSKGHWIFLRHSVSLVWVWYLRCNISLSVQNTLHFLFWGHDLSIPPSPPSHALLTSWLIFCILLCVFPLLHSPDGATAVQVCRRRTEEEAESEQVPSKRPTVASRRRGKRYRP